MKKITSKSLACLMCIIIAVVCIASVSQAAAVKKALNVYWGTINVKYNNQDITKKVTPIVVNGSTYLPLRSMTNLFNKDLSFSNKTVCISDKETPAVVAASEYTALQSQLASKDAYIRILTQKIEALESSNNSNISNDSTTASNMKDLQNDLNDDYESYKDAEFNISLSGDKNNITLTIKTDEEDWSAIKNSYQEKFMENIVKDIQKVFKTAVISGRIKDGSSTLIEFSASPNQDFVIDSNSLINNLKEKLNDKLNDDDFGKLTGIDNDDLDIAVEGNIDDLTFTIKIDFDDYEDEWEKLTDAAIKDYMKKVYSYIASQSSFEDTDIIGYFYDIDGEDNLAKLYSNGDSFKIY
ncbi:MAG: hypothetical protein ACM3KR_07960 [Deltaproteobacteria bacterium]